jgi:hypothetical protein
MQHREVDTNNRMNTESAPSITLVGTTPLPERTDLQSDPQWEELLELLRSSYWEYAKFLHSLARAKKASFERFKEDDDAIRCIHGCLAEISLCLHQQCLLDKVLSFRITRTDAEVRARFGNDSLDLSDLVRNVARATNELSAGDSKIVSDLIINQLFHDEIALPGFAPEVINGDTLVFTLLPDDAKKQLQYREARQPLFGGQAVK